MVKIINNEGIERTFLNMIREPSIVKKKTKENTDYIKF